MKQLSFDPPLTEISKEDHDFVHVEITSSSQKAIDWFMSHLSPELRDRIICECDNEDV